MEKNPIYGGERLGASKTFLKKISTRMFNLFFEEQESTSHKNVSGSMQCMQCRLNFAEWSAGGELRFEPIPGPNRVSSAFYNSHQKIEEEHERVSQPIEHFHFNI